MTHDDPDSHGLPPGVRLPDAGRYKCAQLRAMTSVNLLTLAAIVVIWVLTPEHRTIVGWCGVAVAAVAAVSLVRYRIARRKLAKRE